MSIVDIMLRRVQITVVSATLAQHLFDVNQDNIPEFGFRPATSHAQGPGHQLFVLMYYL